MKLRKFFGLTSRSVLDQVRAELGPDAVIVANRPTPDGIEITAVAGDAMDNILSPRPAAPQAMPALALEEQRTHINSASPLNASPVSSASGAPTAEVKQWSPPRVTA